MLLSFTHLQENKQYTCEWENEIQQQQKTQIYITVFLLQYCLIKSFNPTKQMYINCAFFTQYFVNGNIIWITECAWILNWYFMSVHKGIHKITYQRQYIPRSMLFCFVALWYWSISWQSSGLLNLWYGLLNVHDYEINIHCCFMSELTRTTRTPAFWDTPRRPMITHTSDSHHIQNKTKSKLQILKNCQKYKFWNLARNFTRDTPSEVS